MKNVCFFNSIRFWGGGEKLHLEYAVEFKKKKYKVYIASDPISSLFKKAQENDLLVYPITVKTASFVNFFKIIQLIIFYRKQKIDTVIFSASQDVKIGSIAAKLAGVERIVYLRGLAVPIKANLMNRIVFKYVLTHIVSNSDETKRSVLKELGKYIPAQKVHTIYHGIEIPKKTENKHLLEIQSQAKGVVLGSAGRLTAQKGQTALLKTAKIIKDQGVEFTLFIAGTGELKAELEAMIHELDLSKEVILLGFVEDMEAFMQSIDIFLLSSLWEGFGYVLVEAMVQSKPIVAFDISSNPEIIADQENGFLIQYPDINAFAQRVIQLINDQNLRNTMGEHGRSSVLNRFVLSDRVTEFEMYLLK